MLAFYVILFRKCKNKVMPKISERGEQMPASPIRRLVPYAEKARKKGIKVYHLNIGQPDIKTPENAIETLKTIDKTVLEYSHSAGYESYRKGLAGYYRNVGVNIDYEQLLITTGGSEAIMFAFLSCLNPGDEVIIPEPFYTNYNGFAVATGVKVVPVTSSIDDDFALPAIEKFEGKITGKTKAIMICNPNNPTGYIYSREELEALRRIVLKYDLYLFADEVYREFDYDGTEHFSVMNLEGIEDRVVMVDSVSKRYSACGIRIGALMSRNQAIIDTALKYAQARLSPPGLGQIVAEASLDTPPEYFQEVYDEYVARRNLVVEKLNKIEGVTTPNPKGAFYTVVRMPVDDADKFCQWLLEDFSYENQTVMLAPASGFYATPGLGKNEARLAYVLNQEDLTKAVDILKIAFQEYPGRTL
jgi:aspartate aminotransferase